jgi:DNA-binding NarL/FixJ family response regulator
MPPIRVLLAETVARLRAEVRDALAGQPDLIVVGDASDEVEVLLQAERADVVIVGMSGTTLPSTAERLIDEYPRIGVIAIDIDREQGLLYQLRPQLSRIAELTPAGLAAAIRRVAAELAT